VRRGTGGTGRDRHYDGGEQRREHAKSWTHVASLTAGWVSPPLGLRPFRAVAFGRF
jgi:hypothetical protein